MIRGPDDGARFDLKDDLAEADEIDMVVAAQWVALVLDATWRFALERDLSLDEFDFKRVFVEDLEEPCAQDAMHFVRGADDREGPWIL